MRKRSLLIGINTGIYNVYMPINEEFIQGPLTAVGMWNTFSTTVKSQCLMGLSLYGDQIFDSLLTTKSRLYS